MNFLNYNYEIVHAICWLELIFSIFLVWSVLLIHMVMLLSQFTFKLKVSLEFGCWTVSSWPQKEVQSCSKFLSCLSQPWHTCSLSLSLFFSLFSVCSPAFSVLGMDLLVGEATIRTLILGFMHQALKIFFMKTHFQNELWICLFVRLYMFVFVLNE